METSNLPAILGAAALVIVAVISSFVSLTLSARARHDKRSTVVDERRLVAFETLWRIVGSTGSLKGQHEEKSMSSRDGHTLANSIHAFIASDKGVYISNEIEYLLIEICNIAISERDFALFTSKKDEVRDKIRAEID
ncbi:hypothetical protein [Tateyamaria sp.]|uniref:hypothetical protein n=1 Tax=Tateyamaria sp. TaxID=1929288 RepID=UPI0032A00D7B